MENKKKMNDKEKLIIETNEGRILFPGSVCPTTRLEVKPFTKIPESSAEYMMAQILRQLEVMNNNTAHFIATIDDLLTELETKLDNENQTPEENGK